MNKRANNEITNINSIVEYEYYLSTKYDFLPMNINEEDTWEKVIRGEGRKTTHLVWYKKFIKKYAKKKLIPDKKLVEALIIAGCDEDKASDIVYGNKFRELLFYFRKTPKKRKPKIFYQGELSKREKEKQLLYNLDRIMEEIETLDEIN